MVKIILISILFILLDIVDFILTVISYDRECLTYFILRFISQPFCLFFIFTAINFGEHIPDQKNRKRGLEEGLMLIWLIFSSKLVFGMEIPSLIYFIKKYSILSLSAIIGYYMHCSIFLLVIIYFLFLAHNNCYDNYCE